MAEKHIVIGGSSYTGSTLFGLMLGVLDGVENVGESNWLVPKFGEASADNALWNNYSALPQCRLCGEDCRIWTRQFRQELQRDPTGWYDRVGDRLGGHTLVSSEKSMSNILTLDPSVNNKTLVLFKSPFQHWASFARRPWKTQSLKTAMNSWSRVYEEFLDDETYRPTRGKVFLNIETFLDDPEAGLGILCDALSLPHDPAMLRYWESRQHYIGGNFNVYERMKESPEKLPVRASLQEVERSDVEAIRSHPANSTFETLKRRSIL